jgi:hypothetical protein
MFIEKTKPGHVEIHGSIEYTIEEDLIFFDFDEAYQYLESKKSFLGEGLLPNEWRECNIKPINPNACQFQMVKLKRLS